jgi:hypothetical protein
MIRSGSIPQVLNRICDDTIYSALLVTMDGELMGTSTAAHSYEVTDPEALGALLADIAVDYGKLGQEYAGLDAVQRSKSHLQCLLMELELGLVCVSFCTGLDCLVVCLAKADAPPGLVKAKLLALAAHVQEAFSTLAENAR